MPFNPDRPTCAWCRTRDGEVRYYESFPEKFYWICFECLEAIIERENAVYENPELVNMMPPLPTPTWRPK